MSRRLATFFGFAFAIGAGVAVSAAAELLRLAGVL